MLARRGKYKKHQKILKNYETSGHNLDTIMAQLFPSQKEILASFIVPILHTFGHLNCKLLAHPPMQIPIIKMILQCLQDTGTYSRGQKDIRAGNHAVNTIFHKKFTANFLFFILC